ncbi:MAG: hypothetical protein QXQ41_01380, partial [Candidatus Bathyarchaeia archaeon]
MKTLKISDDIHQKLTALLGELTAQLRRRPVVFHLDKAREALAGSWMCSAQKAREQLGFSTPKTLLE